MSSFVRAYRQIKCEEFVTNFHANTNVCRNDIMESAMFRSFSPPEDSQNIKLERQINLLIVNDERCETNEPTSSASDDNNFVWRKSNVICCWQPHTQAHALSQKCYSRFSTFRFCINFFSCFFHVLQMSSSSSMMCCGFAFPLNAFETTCVQNVPFNRINERDRFVIRRSLCLLQIYIQSRYWYWSLHYVLCHTMLYRNFYIYL